MSRSQDFASRHQLWQRRLCRVTKRQEMLRQLPVMSMNPLKIRKTQVVLDHYDILVVDDCRIFKILSLVVKHGDFST